MSPLEALRRRAERSFAHLTITDACASLRRAIVGPRSTAHVPGIPDAALAERALAKLRGHDPDPPTEEELAALSDAIRIMRPSMVSRAGQIEEIPAEFDSIFPAWRAFSAEVRPFLRAIGRIDRQDFDRTGRGLKPHSTALGTGFLLADRLIVTNLHVLDQLTSCRRGIQKGRALVRFGMEWKTKDEPFVAIERVAGVDESSDLALLQTAPIPGPGARRSLVLADRMPELGAAVVTIGYPGCAPGGTAGPFARVTFKKRLGVKRAAPGEVIALHGAPEPSFFDHDCSTLSGCSGSPVLDMNTLRVVGVHRGGEFLARNESIGPAQVRMLVARSTAQA